VGRAQRGALCVQRPKGTQKNMRRTRVEMVAAGSIEEAWSTLAQKMRDQDESASTEEWNELISFAVAKDDLEKAVYFLELMKVSEGQVPAQGIGYLKPPTCFFATTENGPKASGQHIRRHPQKVCQEHSHQRKGNRLLPC